MLEQPFVIGGASAGRLADIAERARKGQEVGWVAPGPRGADLRAFFSHTAVQLREQIVPEAAARRDRDVRYASQQLAEWRRAMGSRQGSQPPMAHTFDGC